MDKGNLEKTRCIVLRYTEYKDNTYIVQMYAEDYGVVAVNVKVGKRSKMRMAYLYPLSRLDCVLSVRPSRDVHSLIDCEVRGNVVNGHSPMASMIKMFLAEVLTSTLRGQVYDNMLFNYIDTSVDFLESSKIFPVNLHLVFLVSYTRYLGFFPNITNFQKDSLFDLKRGEFTKEIPSHTLYLDIKKSIIFANLLRVTYSTMHLFELSREERAEVLDYIMQYYMIHINDFKVPRSLAVLRAM